MQMHGYYTHDSCSASLIRLFTSYWFTERTSRYTSNWLLECLYQVSCLHTCKEWPVCLALQFSQS